MCIQENFLNISTLLFRIKRKVPKRNINSVFSSIILVSDFFSFKSGSGCNSRLCLFYQAFFFHFSFFRVLLLPSLKSFWILHILPFLMCMQHEFPFVQFFSRISGKLLERDFNSVFLLLFFIYIFFHPHQLSIPIFFSLLFLSDQLQIFSLFSSQIFSCFLYLLSYLILSISDIHFKISLFLFVSDFSLFPFTSCLLSTPNN